MGGFCATVVTAGETQTLGKMPEGPPPIQEHKIALAPFYRLRSNGSKTWMERILVTFTVAAPKDRLHRDIDNPTFRKIFYELLLSGEPEATIRAQAVDHLQKQVGMKVDPAVEISRSFLIVR